MCGRSTGHITNDPEIIDCETCKQRYENNKEWYRTAVRRVSNGICGNCDTVIEVMAYRGTGACSENCKDALERGNA